MGRRGLFFSRSRRHGRDPLTHDDPRYRRENYQSSYPSEPIEQNQQYESWDYPTTQIADERRYGPEGAPPGTYAGPAWTHTPQPGVLRRVAGKFGHWVRSLARLVDGASKADGAGESGLSRFVWVHAIQTAADAMVAVCLAGTIFFSAATSEQRSKVALYLLITMAPFALVAPLIGPLLDRMHHGRRFALACSIGGRAVLVFILAHNFHNIALYPTAFGVLVLSKGYAVLRGACVPRLLPQRMTLISANARLTFFGSALSAIAGGLVAGFIKITGSYPWGLYVTMLVLIWGAVLAIRLPKHVDSAANDTTSTFRASGAFRLRQPLGSHVVNALRSVSALRGLTGFLMLFMAFLVQHNEHGLVAAATLGAVLVAIAAGSFIGVAAGARLPLTKPDTVILLCLGGAAFACLIATAAYSALTAALVGLATGFATGLSKLCLDSIIQREIPDTTRASAFGRSETALQLAWVFGGGIGIALPSSGLIGFAVATGLMAAAFTLALVRGRGLVGRPRAQQMHSPVPE